MNLWIRFETKFRRALTFKPRKASRAHAGNKTRIRCKEGQDNYFALSCRFHLRSGFCLRQQPHGRVSNDNHRGGRRPFHYASYRPGAGTESRKQSIDWLSLVSGKYSKLYSYQSR
jgi:hypothetical protein